MRFRNINISIKNGVVPFFSLLLLTAAACNSGGGEESTSIDYRAAAQSQTYTGPGQEVYKVSTAGNVELTYTLTLGASIRDVYFIFTNSSVSSDTNSPYFLNGYNIAEEDYPLEESSVPAFSSLSASKSTAGRGKPEITDFNSNPWKHLGIDRDSASKPVYSAESETYGPLLATLGDAFSFKYNSATVGLIPAKCRKIITGVHGRTLNIWVADDCWTTGGTKANLITQAMVDAMADKFLQAGAGNDIYEWVTNIYGAEWGAHSSPNLIAPDSEIHILLYDIDNDNSTTGGTLGFFWAKDNFKTSSVSYSNARIMFYIDAVLYAEPSGGWVITDPWPEEIISTLAHEFQHMINFYQKNIVSGASDSDTWMNEMCSLVAEELVADKLGVTGPSSRLSTFNLYDDAPLTEWLSGNDALISYAVSYAFGAYLARNYGGAALFQDIVHGGYGDYRDVLTAVNNNGGSGASMLGLLRDWGVAVVLSDNLLIAGNYKYSAYSALFGSFTYNLPAIDLTSYTPDPNYYASTDLSSAWPAYRSSNTYVKVSSQTGTKTWKFRMRDTVQATVVVR
jgi:hypothetical protein